MPLRRVVVSEQRRRLLHCPPRPREATLLGRCALVPLHRGAQAVDGQVGQFLGDPFEALTEVIEVLGHAGTLRG